MITLENHTLVKPVQLVNIGRHLLADDGQFPNNALLPLLVYPAVLQLPAKAYGQMVEEIFESNVWNNTWQDSVYDFHHYHSTAHEVLGIFRGSARIQFGGPSGVMLLLEKGDVVIIPAGVAHKAIDVYDNFTCVGSYPKGQEYDMNYGHSHERAQALENIRTLPLPKADPVFGYDGPLLANWTS
jgi:uncharacterized protein YjlB